MSLPFPHARLGNMISLDRLQPALQSPWIPLALLLLALSTVFVFRGDQGHFYRPHEHNGVSSDHLRIAVNLSPEHGFQRFTHRFIDEDGDVRHDPYNRFPIGGYASMKLATLPFEGSPSAQLYAARVLMLLFFAGAAVLAYLSLCRLASNRWIALTATLLAFSSYYLLYYNDMTAGEGMPDFFGVMLAFHGMVVFVQEGRFRQLLVKTCVALLFGWHVLALLVPFVIFGLARDLLRARSAAASSTPPSPLCQVKHAAAPLFRSRYLLFGIVALGFGLSVLTFNFTMEYIALGWRTPLTELPSFESMLRRSSVDRGFVLLPWDYVPVLEVQFSKIARMFIPYSLHGSGDVHESPTWLPELWVPVLGCALSVAGLIGSIFVRPRILFATLASFGFFWALPMRNTAGHGFESIYYIGIPLVLFTIVLLWARRLTNRDGVIAAATVAALILFVTSSFQMGRVGFNAESAQIMRTAEHDLRTIRKFVAGEHVTVLGLGGNYSYIFHWQWAGPAISYYLNQSIIRTTDDGFTVMRPRVDTDALLTPQNQYLFLYDTAGLMAWYWSTYRSVISTAPLAREEFDVYLIDGTVYYLKEPCYGSNLAVRLSLHVFPEDLDDLPDDREQHGFDNLDSYFYDRGLLFDGKCLGSVDLPQYDIAGFRTGQVRVDGGLEWSIAHVVQGPKLISEYPSIVSGEPIARSEFDLYIDEGKLYYVKELCDSEDVQAGVFLHIVPEDIDDLPDARGEYGFDNLDFRFDVRGVLFDGKCAASVGLPQYDIARITTGQFDGVNRIWEVEFVPEVNE